MLFAGCTQVKTSTTFNNKRRRIAIVYSSPCCLFFSGPFLLPMLRLDPAVEHDQRTGSTAGRAKGRTNRHDRAHSVLQELIQTDHATTRTSTVSSRTSSHRAWSHPSMPTIAHELSSAAFLPFLLAQFGGRLVFFRRNALRTWHPLVVDCCLCLHFVRVLTVFMLKLFERKVGLHRIKAFFFHEHVPTPVFCCKPHSMHLILCRQLAHFKIVLVYLSVFSHFAAHVRRGALDERVVRLLLLQPPVVQCVSDLLPKLLRRLFSLSCLFPLFGTKSVGHARTSARPRQRRKTVGIFLKAVGVCQVKPDGDQRAAVRHEKALLVGMHFRKVKVVPWFKCGTV